MPKFPQKVLWKNLSKKYPCSLIHASDHSFYYLTGLPMGSWASSFAVISKNKPILLSKHPEDSPFETITFSNKKELKKILLDFFQSHKIPSTISLSPIRLKTEKINSFLYQMRSIKYSFEISFLRKANKKAKKLVESAHDLISFGKTTEQELANLLEFQAKEFSYEPLAFPPIVSSGFRTSFVHSFPSKKKIKKDILMIDFGLRYKNYCSDITRTFVFSKKYISTYETIQSIKEQIPDLVKSSSNYSEASKKIANLYKKHFNQNPPHSFGHGLGIQVHDFPFGFSSKCKSSIQPNQTITIEPAYYSFKKFGIRIEDDYLLSKSKKPILF